VPGTIAATSTASATSAAAGATATGTQGGLKSGVPDRLRGSWVLWAFGVLVGMLREVV
jgi:hypothetical protein